MRIRTIAQLKAIQARMLDSYRQERLGADVTARADAAVAVSGLSVGRVDEVVTSDEEYGPHLKIALQRFAGSPPTPTDASGALQVYYPAPSKVLSDYALDEFVGLIAVSHTRIAFKL